MTIQKSQDTLRAEIEVHKKSQSKILLKSVESNQSLDDLEQNLKRNGIMP